MLTSAHGETFLLDIAVMRSLGIEVVLCLHARRRLERFVGDDGIAEEKGEHSEELLAELGRFETEVEGWCRKAGLRWATAQILTVRRLGILEGKDQGLRGRVDAVDQAGLRGLIDQGWMPLVPAMAIGTCGRALLLDGFEVGRAVAESLGAAKLIFASGDEGVSSWLSQGPLQHSVREVGTFLESPELTAPMKAMMRQGRRACENGVSRAHLVDGKENGALLEEIFLSEGVGSMIYADQYRSMRRAIPGDVKLLQEMMRHSVEDGQLRERSVRELEDRFEDYFVLELDGNVLGCAALHVYEEAALGEVAAVFVHPGYGGRGYGTSLIGKLIEEGKRAGLQSLFAYSTQAVEFFSEQMGFEEVEDADWIPRSRSEEQRKSGRNARLFRLPLC
ncbi:MAG: GNAT family N-acetyltransferase [Verrucomicrobiota bacterium]